MLAASMPDPRKLLLLPSAIHLSLCLCLATGTANASEWELQKQAEGIDVHTRSLADSAVREFKGEGIVGVEIDAIVDLLRDSSRFKDWFPNTSESRLLERDGDVSYQYSVMSMPWPISDRDNIFRLVFTRDESTGRVELSIAAAPDYHPVQRRHHRVTRAKGSWLLTPNGPDETHVRFTMHLEPGGGIPVWMVNAEIVSTPFGALVNMRRILGAKNDN